MIRLAAALILMTLTAPGIAEACVFPESRVKAPPTSPAPGPAPPPPRIVDAAIDRGICHDIGALRLTLGRIPLAVYAYRVSVVAGEAPPGLARDVGLHAARDGQISLIWVDRPAEMRRTYAFALEIRAVDDEGRASPPVIVKATAGAFQPPQYTPPRRRVPPWVWLAGFAALFGLGPLVGWLRRPRIAPA